jgi:hypothetical protein
METRLHMESKDRRFFIESDTGLGSLTVLENLRKSDKRFKYQRIRCVLQAYPSEVVKNEIIERNK